MRTFWPVILCLPALSTFAAADSASDNSSNNKANGSIETLTVRAARMPIDTGKLGSAVNELGADDLRARQVASVADALRSIPGVAVSRSGGLGAQTQLRLRGSEANHVLVFIDGIAVNDPAQGDEFNFAHLLNDQFSSIEVIRGPQSALWGTGAVSGVINIVSAAPLDGSTAEVFVEGGADGYGRVSASGGYADERLRLRATAQHLDTDGQNSSRSGNEEDGYQNTTASLGLGYELTPALRIDSALRYTDSSADFDGTDFTTGLLSDRDNESDSEQLYARVAAVLDTLDGRWNHQLGVNLTDTDNVNTTENAFAPSGFDVNSSAAKLYRYSYQSSFELTERHRLTAAIEHHKQSYQQRGPVGFGDPNRNESLRWNSAIAEYYGDLTDRLSVLASVRHDRNSDFDDANTGRISAAWRLADGNTKLRAAYGIGVKNPTFSERFGFFTNFIGNPDLQPEESKGWEVGVDQLLFDGALALQLTWFDEQLEDEINGFVFDPNSGGFTAANDVGDSERQGLEASAQWQLGERWRLALAYTWLDASEEDANGRQVDEIRRAEHIANLNLGWQPSQRLSLNLNVDHNGSQDDFFFPPVPPFQERVSLDSFTLVNLAGSLQVTPALSVFARVENAFDEQYEELLGFSALSRAAYVGVRYQPFRK